MITNGPYKNNLNLLTNLKNQNIISKFSKKFFYFGLLSCILLTLHALFLGLDFDSELFQKLRRVIIILFILFEILAQAFLTRILFKFKEELKNYINPLFLKIKIAFVSIIFFITFISFSLFYLVETSLIIFDSIRLYLICVCRRYVEI